MVNTVLKKVMATVFIAMSVFMTSAAIMPTVTAHAVDLGSVLDGIQGDKNNVLGDEPKKKVQGLSNDMIELSLTVIVGIMSVAGLYTAFLFHGAEEPQKKAKLKGRLIGIVGGIIFLASYLGALKFGFTNLSIF